MNRLGAIADDFTGATDLATTLGTRNLRTLVVTEQGLRSDSLTPEAAAGFDAIVFALKTRTAPVPEAVRDSIDALHALRSIGCDLYYDKYCSTFDSTDEGNIGPILDALSSELAADTVLVVPSFPANGRTVEDGMLRVHGMLLEDSSMRHHPLTPMTQSRVSDLLRPQTEHDVSEIPLDIVRQGSEMLAARLSTVNGRYVVIDAVTDEDLKTIMNAASDNVLVSGGSGLALGLEGTREDAEAIPLVAGRRLVLAGSASAATRAQVSSAKKHMNWLKIDTSSLAEDPKTVLMDTLRWLEAQDPEAPALVYAVDSLADVELAPSGTAERIEHYFGEVARRSVAGGGVTQLIVAGGETSGAVVSALGIEQLAIGPQIAPGVCWAHARTREEREVNVSLKSGNFGAEDMFTTAWKVLEQ